MTEAILVIAAAALLLYAAPRVHRRLLLSRAKHRSLGGHNRIARRLAKLVPFYEYEGDEVFRCDGADDALVSRRKAAFSDLRDRLDAKAPEGARLTSRTEAGVSDMQFTNAYRVPFQFRNFVRRNLKLGAFAEATSDVRIRDMDGNWSYDLAGSYGVNLLGYDFYKECIERAVERARDLGPVLGPYHPLVADNVRMLRDISGHDEVSFHMSGTEAVMQAVRLARYHTGRTQMVMFCGAYHGWWDGVQPGVGNTRPADDVFTLKDMSDDTLAVLESRDDIACVLVNPLQALHPNRAAASDAMLIASEREAGFDRGAYSDWLAKLREVCTRKSIVLVFDEVFVGFRLGRGGAQEYFGVRADMVTYGKTLGGGLPIGALCGRADLMKRFREDRPTDICFARGTFNSHPYVMASMNEFLKLACSDAFALEASRADQAWNERAAELNARFETEGLPVRVRNLSSIWVVTYPGVSRFNWLYQYYLRAEGLYLGWVGTGRLIFSHNYSGEDFREVTERVLRAARAMQSGGWWEAPPGLTSRAIRKRVLREMLSARLAGKEGVAEKDAPAAEAGARAR